MTNFPLTFPTTKAPRYVRLAGHNVVAVSTAPFSGVQQVQEHPGKWWLGEFTLPLLSRASADVWLAWLDSLNGPAGTFLLGHPKRRTSKGTAAATPGAPTVDGVGQTGNALAIKTGLSTTAGYMKAGDFFSLGLTTARRLYRLTADVTLNSGGKATLAFWPRLRAVPADNAVVYVANATGLFRLTGNEVSDETDESGLVTIASVPFVEAL